MEDHERDRIFNAAHHGGYHAARDGLIGAAAANVRVNIRASLGLDPNDDRAQDVFDEGWVEGFQVAVEEEEARRA